MKNKSKVLAGLVLVGVGLLVLMIAFTGRDMSLLSPSNNASSTDNAIESQQSSKPSPGSMGGVNQVTKRRVVYTDTGFSPFLVEVAAGDEIEFVNRSSAGLWITTKQHPTAGEQNYDAFDTGHTLASGEIFTFAFTKVGTWGYKNLNNNAHLGAVVVTPQR